MPEAKSSSGPTIGGCFLLLVIVVGGGGWLYTKMWNEQEGDARYEDCRNKIAIQEGSTDALFKSFTCNYVKTRSGKILSGTCVHVVTEGPVCQTAYIYNKKSQVVCNDPKFPYAGYDDLCHSDPHGF
jgi:hypothetical protein